MYHQPSSDGSVGVILFLFAAYWWLTSAAVGVAIAQHRGADTIAAAFLGLFLGPLGIAFSVCSRPIHECPACRRGLVAGASKCGHCGTESKKTSPPELPEIVPVVCVPTPTPPRDNGAGKLLEDWNRAHGGLR